MNKQKAKREEREIPAGEPQNPAALRVAFGRRLRTLRHHRVMSQKALADQASVSLNTIGSIERGLRFPSPEVLEGLATALHVEVRELFDTGEHAAPATLEGAARELCRIVESQLLPNVEKLTTVARDLLREVEGQQRDGAQPASSGTGYVGTGVAPH